MSESMRFMRRPAVARPIDLLLVHRLVSPGARWRLARHATGERPIPGGVVYRRWIFVAVLCLGGVIPMIFGCAGVCVAGADGGACPTCPAGADAAACPAGADAAACQAGADAAACPTCPACPSGVEICDGVDNDGDGVVDEGCGAPDGWTRTWGGSEADPGAAVAVGSDGAVFVAGDFRGTVDFDPGAGVDSRTAAGEIDVFVTKLTSAGDHAWARTWGGVSSDQARDVAALPDGSVVVAGDFRGTVDFDPGPGVDSRTALGAGGNGFVTLLGPDGAYGWTWTSAALALAVAAGPDGSVAVAGAFFGTVDFDPGPGEDSRTSAGTSAEADVFVTKLAADGSYLWTRTWGGEEGADMGWGVAVGPDGSIHVAGQFSGMVDFDPGPGTDSRRAESRDAFLTKLDADGAHVWTRVWGWMQADGMRAVAVGADGAVVVAGTFSGSTFDLDPGPGVNNVNGGTVPAAFMVKLDFAGAYAWGRFFPGVGCTGAAGSAYPRSVALGVDGSVLLAGAFSHCVGFGLVPPSGDHDLLVAQGNDAFATRYRADGAYDWTATLGGAGEDSASDVSVGAGGAVFVTGDFGQSFPPSTADFDPGPRLDRRTSAGASDAFLAKLAP